MIRRTLEKQVGAYRDGELSESRADAVRRRLEGDAQARAELARYESIGRLAREAWRDGPPAPSAELLIAALRPGMARIDAELEGRQAARGRGWFAPLPVFAMGAAAAVLIAVMLQTGSSPGPIASVGAPEVVARAQSSGPPAVQPVANVAQTESDELPVYDLAQGDSPLVVFEDDGTTFIWLLEEPKRGDDLSRLPVASGGWV